MSHRIEIANDPLAKLVNDDPRADIFRENKNTINCKYAEGNQTYCPYFIGSMDIDTIKRLNL